MDALVNAVDRYAMGDKMLRQRLERQRIMEEKGIKIEVETIVKLVGAFLHF